MGISNGRIAQIESGSHTVDAATTLKYRQAVEELYKKKGVNKSELYKVPFIPGSYKAVSTASRFVGARAIPLKDRQYLVIWKTTSFFLNADAIEDSEQWEPMRDNPLERMGARWGTTVYDIFGTSLIWDPSFEKQCREDTEFSNKMNHLVDMGLIALTEEEAIQKRNMLTALHLPKPHFTTGQKVLLVCPYTGKIDYVDYDPESLYFQYMLKLGNIFEPSTEGIEQMKYWTQCVGIPVTINYDTQDTH